MGLPEARLGDQLHRWSRRQYESMIAGGVFDPEERLELLDGEVLTMSPQSSRHATTVQLVTEALRGILGPGHHVRTQLPLALDDHSEPEPDVAVVLGAPRDYRDHHPTTAVLIVEVAETSLAYDRGPKLAAYARQGIAEVWIVDLVASELLTHRRPEGGRYHEVARLARQGRIDLAGRRLSIADLLP